MSRPLPEGVQFIERGWLNANHLVIHGDGLHDDDGPVLIDTGHSRDETATVEVLRGAGVEPERLRLIVNTHCHPDHWGGNRRLQELSGAPIACGTATAEIFARDDHRAMWIEYFGSEVYHEPTVAPPGVDRAWSAGETARLGPFDFEILDAPGHAPDSIALWQPEHRLLVSADALHDGDCGILHVAVHGNGVVRDALETVERFRALGARVAVPGHGPLILDVDDALDRLEERLRGFERDPTKLARHLCGRVLMSVVLAVQPISLDDLCALAIGARWFEDYGSLLGVSEPERLVRTFLDDFHRRGLVRLESGLFRSNVPR